MNLSVVIPCRKEPRLAETVRSIDSTTEDKPEIIVVFDGEPKAQLPHYTGVIKGLSTGSERIGTSAARNRGIFCASGEKILTCDGHMLFPEGWQDVFIDELERHQKGVLCSKCAYLTNENNNLETAKVAGHGAKIHWKDKVSDKETRALTAKWFNNSVGEIGAIMGACYAFNKSWYIYGLSAPWSDAVGWGLDEEVLSVSNWICGGNNRLVDVAVGHWFGHATRGTPLTFGNNHLSDVWANRIRMLQDIPMSAEDYKELFDWIITSAYYQKHTDEILKRVKSGRLRQHLSYQKRTFSDYKKEWIKC